MAENKFAKYAKDMKFTVKARTFKEYLDAVYKLSKPSTMPSGKTEFKGGSDRPVNKVNVADK